MGRRLRPVSRRVLVKLLRRFGWHGPTGGGSHSYMRKDGRRLTIPNDHGYDIPVGMLSRILDRAGIDHDEWEGARAGRRHKQ